MLAIVAPGQGAQTPGFLSPWLELPGLRDRAQALSDAAEVDLVTHGTTSDADTIKDTAVAQPLIVGAGLLAFSALFDADHPADAVGVGGGHSVGEITAAAFTGVLGDDDAMRFVGTRGRAMAQAAAVTPTGMAAVLGGDPDEVLAVIERHSLTPANVNGGGQIVAAGTMEQLAALREDPPAKAKVIPLQVAGAFHTEHMAPAVEELAALANTLTPAAPRVRLLSNKDGQVVDNGDEVLQRLVSQVSNPVRWDLCQQTMLDLGVTGLIELAPAGTLVGLAKRAMKGVAAVAVKTPDDIDQARALIAEHGGAADPSSTTSTAGTSGTASTEESR
ncbi:ACP S-malonyltransferase [Arsenicicoccus piscis]|nr:ACP S-malonyltransferase [Arsenicicoccus piscis]